MGSSVGEMNCIRQFGRVYTLPRDSKEATRDLAVAAAEAAAPSTRGTAVQEEAAAAATGWPCLHRGTVLKAAAMGSATASWSAASSSRGVVAKESPGPPRRTAPSNRGVVVQMAAGAPRKPTSSTPASSTRAAVVEVTTAAPTEGSSSAASSTRGAELQGAAPAPRKASSSGTASSTPGGTVVQVSAAEAPRTSLSGTASAQASFATASAAADASMTATASEALPAKAPNAPSVKEQHLKRKMTSGQKKVQFLREIHPYLPEGPLKIRDDSIFKQIAQAIQDHRGTSVNFTGLSGEECLRQVLPPGIKVGRGKPGLYRAARDFFRDEL